MDMPLRIGKTQGRPNLFQGQTPGVSGTAGNGAFPFGPMNPTKTVNQTMGWQTNYTINYAYVARKFKDDSDNALNVGQLVFLRRKPQPAGDKRLTTLANIVQVNHLMHKCNEPTG